MGKVRAHISTSLDGYVAGPNQSMEQPLGENGEHLHNWLVQLKSWREGAGMDGGSEGVNDEVFREVTSNVGAEIMGRGTTLVLLAPGMGDGIQAAKAGILEIGDLYVVNKADRDGANSLRRELRSMLALAERPDGAWTPEILLTVASANEGIDEVVAAVDQHRDWLARTGELQRRRTRRARDEIEAIAVTSLRAQWRGVHERTELDALAERVVAGQTDPYAAADELLEATEG